MSLYHKCIQCLRVSNWLSPGFLFMAPLGKNQSAMLYHPLQTEQNLSLTMYLRQTEAGFRPSYMNDLGRLKIFTAAA